MTRSLITLIGVLLVSSAGSGSSAPARTHPPASAGPLEFYYDLYTFRGDAGSTRVVASFAVPVGRLKELDLGDEVRYRFDVSLVLADTVLQSIVRSDDSVFVAATRPLADEHLLYTQVEVQAPPSRSTVHRVTMTDASTPGTGQLYDAFFPIPDYGGDTLMLSDIGLGDPDVDGGWRRGDVALALLPTSQFPSSEFDVYYEIYNLPPSTRYTTEIAVEPVADPEAGDVADAMPIRLRFSGRTPGWSEGWIQELRRVEAALARGRYRLTVAITDEAADRTVTRSRVFQVRGWEPGATMVAALPRVAPVEH